SFFFSSRRRHTRSKRDWSSDVCSSDLAAAEDRLVLVEGVDHEVERRADLRHADDGERAARAERVERLADDGEVADRLEGVVGAEIGRASCRERVESRGVEGAGEKKETG